jgi:ATP-dependent RNA helicase RhlE
MSFLDLGLKAELLRAVADQGYSEPTPVQRRAIPFILEGRDILAGAQTGTGKTAGFTLPILQRLSDGIQCKGWRPVRALVLSPTRELAAQVRDSVSSYGRHLPLRSAAIFGGVNIRPQIQNLRKGVDILVATPGRLQDHLDQGTVQLGEVEVLVLDEADRMLDMGFLPAIRKIIALLPRNRQNLLFSATYSKEIRELSAGILRDPETIQVARRSSAAVTVTHTVHPVDKPRKRELLRHLIHSNNWRMVLVFARTKHGAEKLAKQLDRSGLQAAAIHGDKSQNQRMRALNDFKSGRLRVLVATDVASRGLDIEQLPHVVNYELPMDADSYVHRIGRTGRAGQKGEAVSLVCVDEHVSLREIERLIKKEIPKLIVSGFEPDPNVTLPTAAGTQRGNKTSGAGHRHGKRHVSSDGKQQWHRRADRKNRKPGRDRPSA